MPDDQLADPARFVDDRGARIPAPSEPEASATAPRRCACRKRRPGHPVRPRPGQSADLRRPAARSRCHTPAHSCRSPRCSPSASGSHPSRRRSRRAGRWLRARRRGRRRPSGWRAAPRRRSKPASGRWSATRGSTAPRRSARRAPGRAPCRPPCGTADLQPSRRRRSVHRRPPDRSTRIRWTCATSPSAPGATSRRSRSRARRRGGRVRETGSSLPRAGAASRQRRQRT